MPQIEGMPKVVKRAKCEICQTEKPLDQLFPGAMIRPSVLAEIQREYPHFDTHEYICAMDLQRFRYEQMRRLIEEERGELSLLDQEVIETIKKHEVLEAHLISDEMTFGERMADRIASFGGSWSFIGLYFLFLGLWIVGNVFLLTQPFDAFPFILLNLILSTIAALQAPVILMSQNRQSARDRHREEHDYKINLKAELEIRMLHEKLDRLMTSQWQRLIEIQQIQMDFMREISVMKKSPQ